MKKTWIGAGALGLVVVLGWVFLNYFAPKSGERLEEDLVSLDGAKVLARGTFAGADAVHEVSGSVSLIAQDGKSILRFENYEATDGPDVFFYISHGKFDSKTASKVLVPQSQHQGQATARGDFAVPLPADLKLELPARIVAWCERFSVEFGSAELQK